MCQLNYKINKNCLIDLIALFNVVFANKKVGGKEDISNVKEGKLETKK